MSYRDLPSRQKLFAREYLRDLNGSRAVVAAGYTTKTPADTAWQLLNDTRVAQYIEREKAKRLAAVDLKVEDVLRDITNVIVADPREIMETVRCNCRYCWGIGNLYQRTVNEMMADYEKWDHDKKPFDEAGGLGYDRYREPNAECPECAGRGVVEVIINDMRDLSASAASLIAGIKQTANGLEIVLRSKDASIAQAAKYFGLNKETIIHKIKADELSDDALAAIIAAGSIPQE